MFSKKKTTALLLSAMLCFSGMSLSAYAETETTAEAETETTAAADDAETEAISEESEEITSGEYTYRIDEEYGGAVITAYEPKEKNVVLPKEIDGNTVVGLGDFLFNEQSGIETVTIPANVCHIGASAFYGTGIKEFFVDEGHPMYKTVDGVLFSKDGIALVAYPPKKEDKSYTVPDGTEELYHGCFAGNTYLAEIDLPDTIIYIDTWAFAYTTVQTLELPETVTEIGVYSFAYMTRLTDIKIPSQVEYIPSAAFAGCSNLDNVLLNDGLLEIGQGAFAGTAVRSIVIPSTVTNIGYCALGYDVNLTTSYSTLVIYGLQGSIAQTYATDKDTEYNYENNFTFIAKTEAQLKEMLSEGADSEGEADSSENEASGSEEENNVIIEEEKSGNSAFIWKVIIIALGGAVLCGGVCAVAVSSKKNSSKSGKPTDDTKKED
ncbi:MAG: leucine-rich repeat domain-containing protein [Ruminococcus sp.]